MDERHQSRLGRTLSLGQTQTSRGAGTKPDRARGYLHLLGDSEAQLLQTFRGMIPSITARLSQESTKALPVESLPLLWGVNLTEESAASNILLLKFLRAADMDIEAAATRLLETMKFRVEGDINALPGVQMLEHFQGHDSFGGRDVEGRPVMISRYGNMDNDLVFGNADEFVRYRLQMMEKAMAQLNFACGAAEDLCQIHDYSGVPLLFKSEEVKGSVSAMAKVLSAHYPETKGVTIFVKFPLAFAKLFQAFSSFIPEKTRKKFVILSDSDQGLLFKYIQPEFVPERLGGMMIDQQQQQQQRLANVACHEVSVSPRSCTEVVLQEMPSAGAAIAWELRACSQDVDYEIVFVPHGEAPEVVVTMQQRLAAKDGVVSGEYTSQEAGTLVCKFRNPKGWFQDRLCLFRASAID
jgi:hypothetical protein